MTVCPQPHLSFLLGCIQWICLKIEQKWKSDSREPGTYTKSLGHWRAWTQDSLTTLIPSAQEWVGSDCEQRCSRSVWMAWPRAVCLYSTAHGCFRKCVGKCCSQALTSKVLTRSLVVWWAKEPSCCPLSHMVSDPALDGVIEVTECAFQKQWCSWSWFKWKEPLMGCNPTTTQSGKCLWSQKVQPKGIAQNWQRNLVLKCLNSKGHPTGKAGNHSKSPGTGQEETSTSAFNCSSGLHNSCLALQSDFQSPHEQF